MYFQIGNIPASVDALKIFRKVSFFDLEVFEAIAVHRSLAAASREKNLSAPHVTKCLERLERKLGMRLIHRTRTGARLTPEGERFALWYAKIKDSVQHAPLSPTQVTESNYKGTITLAGLSFVMTGLVSSCIQDPAIQALQHRFQLIETSHEEMVALLHEELFQILLHVNPFRVKAPWKTAELGFLKYGLFAGKEHPIQSRVSSQIVERFPFIVPGYLVKKQFRPGDDKCPLPVARRKHQIATPTVESALRIAIQSKSLVFAAHIAAAPWLARGLIREVRVSDWPLVREKLYFTYHSGNLSNPMFKELFSALERNLPR
jgi:DNA-binding transcriptional LysR family regulator